MAVPKRKIARKKIIRPYKLGFRYKSKKLFTPNLDLLLLKRKEYVAYKGALLERSSYPSLLLAKKALSYKLSDFITLPKLGAVLKNSDKVAKRYHTYRKLKALRHFKQANRYPIKNIKESNIWRLHHYNLAKARFMDDNSRFMESLRCSPKHKCGYAVPNAVTTQQQNKLSAFVHTS